MVKIKQIGIGQMASGTIDGIISHRRLNLITPPNPARSPLYKGKVPGWVFAKHPPHLIPFIQRLSGQSGGVLPPYDDITSHCTRGYASLHTRLRLTK